MSNGYFHNPQSNERAMKIMHAKISIGAAGAPTLARGQRFVSVSKTATGTLLITLDKFNYFLSANIMLEWATAIDDSYQVLSVNAAAGTITIGTKTAGVLADLPSGSILHLDLLFKNTSVKF